jgi:cbb3-type cytochrome oxidase subunit 3
MSAANKSMFKKIISNRYFWITIVVAILAGLIVFLYWQNSKNNYQRSAQSLFLLQDILTETASVKIMGDSIVDGHPTPKASYANAIAAATKSADQLAVLSVPEKLKDYKRAAVSWTNRILAGAKNPGTWNKLINAPGDFQLELNDNKAEEWLNVCLQNIAVLKEFGDTAIENNDREAMRYIAAKLLVQQHWLKGIMHSEDVSFLSFAGTPAHAEYINGMYIPDVGPSGCVEVPGGPPCPSSQPRNTYTPPQTTPTKSKSTTDSGTADAKKTQTPERTYRAVPIKNALVPGQNFTFGPERTVCPGRGSCQSASYESAVQSVTASAIDFAEGRAGAAEKWKNTWKELNKLMPEGQSGTPPSWPAIAGGHSLETSAGVTAEGGSPKEALAGVTVGVTGLSIKLSPLVQLFYDQCKSRNGIVGGANTVKAKLPTTESGYICVYEYDSPAWGKNPCWDFLTYSGGRYLGGNTGCPEGNLFR